MRKYKKQSDQSLLKRNVKEMLDAQISERGYNWCEQCGKTRPVSAHHIIFRSEKPGHPFLHAKINLILVCGTDVTGCHGEFHRHKGARNKLVVDRSLHEWFGNDVLDK
jgi:hypothetical protein